MASEVIPCPACGHSVRVPESLFGHPVRCPACKAYFVAPVRDADGQLGQAELLDDMPPPETVTEDPRLTSGKSPFFIPGLLLLLVGTCGVVVNGTIAGVLTFRMPQIMQAMRDAFNDPNFKPPEINGQKLTIDDIKEEKFDDLRNASILFTAVSIIVCSGAMAMLVGGAYWLAMLGSVVAIFNVGNCCCLFSAPVGIYCLIKLFDPMNRPFFKR